MKKPDRLGDLAHRQINDPLRDFVFVAAMIGMLLVSLVSVTGAASSLIASAEAAPVPALQLCEPALDRPLERG